MMKLIIFFLYSNFIFAQVKLFPETQNDLFLTRGLFQENGSTGLTYMGKNDFWVELSSHLALAELNPNLQIQLELGIKAALRLEKKEFQSDTQDLRISFNTFFKIDESSRLKFSLTHLSGHTFEDIADPTLIKLNVGDESFSLRYLKDNSHHFAYRYGAQINYIASSNQPIRRLTSQIFFDFFPAGKIDNGTYLSLGVEEYGLGKYRLTTNEKMGIYLVSNLKIHSSIFVGHYYGVNPRQKFSHTDDHPINFFYSGLTFSY